MHPHTTSVQSSPLTSTVDVYSRTRPDVVHTVTLRAGRVVACTCEAGRRGRVCWHTKHVAKVRAAQVEVARALHSRGWTHAQISTLWAETVALLNGDRAAAADVLAAECSVRAAA